MGKIIGIDLGTTNSVVALKEGNDVVVIQNAEGQRTTPSIVGYTEKGERVVGQAAKNQMISNPENTVYSVKRFMGRGFGEVVEEMKLVPYSVEKGEGGDVRIKIRDKKLSPPEISATILQKMKQTAEDYLGEPVSEAVVTVPAYFNDAQRQATKDAGKIAGLDVKRIINEPTAAALAYGLNKNKNKEEKIAVYDLGGGTFDISILELGDGVFEVKSTNGDTHLGGDNFDDEVIKWIVDSFKKDQGIDLSKDRMALQRLREAAEKAKKELSTTQETSINLPFITADSSGPKHLNYTLTRAKFEQMVEHLIARTKEPCLTALKDAGLKPEDIDEVILVGGTTRIPAVQKLVKELFKNEPNKSVNPDEAVAIGAAIQGAILSGDIKDVLLLDVTSLSLGIETMGGVMTKLIPRNTTIPVRKSEIFSTADDNQTAVSIHVLQGERTMSTQNKTLGRFDLMGIPSAPRGVPQIEVTFDIDANGIVHVSAKDLATQKEQKIRIESQSLSDKEVEQMIREAEENADQDKKIFEMAQAKNEAESMIYQTEKTLKEHGEKISEAEKNEVEEKIKTVRAALEAGDLENIKARMEEFKQASFKIAEKMYAQGGAGSQSGSEQGNTHEGAAKGADDEIKYEVVDDEKNKKE